MISIAAGAVTGPGNSSSLASAPSSAVIVSNTEPAAAYRVAILKYPAANGAQTNYEFYWPTNYLTRSNIPVYIHIHGGGWVGGAMADATNIATAVAKKGFIVFNIEYTIKSPSPSPGDVLAFVNYIKVRLLPYHGDPAKISIGGTSAGAHLALVQSTRAENTVNFKCVVDALGPSDLTSIMSQVRLPNIGYYVNAAFGASPPSYLSPALRTANFKGAKLLASHAEQDSLVPIGQTYEVVANLKKAKPSVEITRNYWPNTNTTPTSATHVINRYDLERPIASYLSSSCR
jgi:acetyl esterase/lipase